MFKFNKTKKLITASVMILIINFIIILSAHATMLCSYYTKKNEQVEWTQNIFLKDVPNDVANLYFTKNIALFSLPRLECLGSVMTSHQIHTFCVDNDRLNCIRDYGGINVYGQKNRKKLKNIVFRAFGKCFAVLHIDENTQERFNIFDLYGAETIVIETLISPNIIDAITKSQAVKNVFLILQDETDDTPEIKQIFGDKYKGSIKHHPAWLTEVEIENEMGKKYKKVCIDLQPTKTTLALIEAMEPGVIKSKGKEITLAEFKRRAEQEQCESEDANDQYNKIPNGVEIGIQTNPLYSFAYEKYTYQVRPKPPVYNFASNTKSITIQSNKLASFATLPHLESIMSDEELGIVCIHSSKFKCIRNTNGEIYGANNNNPPIKTIIFYAPGYDFKTTHTSENSNNILNIFDTYKTENIVLASSICDRVMQAIIQANSIKKVFAMKKANIADEHIKKLHSLGKQVIEVADPEDDQWLSVNKDDQLCVAKNMRSLEGIDKLVEAIQASQL